MASLFELLFDTISFSGALDASNVDRASASVGNLSDHIQYVEPSLIAGYRVEAALPPGQALENADPSDLPIWGYTLSANAPQITDVTCRVRDDSFKEYVVLEKIEFGAADLEHSGGFRQEIDVTFLGKTLSLPLDPAARLACFYTDGCENSGADPLWPLYAKQDPGIVQLFVFDVNFFGGSILPLTMLAPGDPAIVEREKFLEACRQVGGPNSETSPLPGLLYQDDLWNPLEEQITDVIYGSWLSDGPARIALAATTIRVAVICSLTPCRERDDYQPGQPGGVGRLYPHILVRATVPLDKIKAGVKFTRPKQTTIKDGLPCGCDEMEGDVGSLLVTDSNDGNTQDLGGLPIPYWNNLFNYYEPVEVGSKMIGVPMTVVKHDAPSAVIENAIMRKGKENKWRVTRVPRQGAFDNIHMAPRMRIPEVARIEQYPRGWDAITIQSIDVDASVREAWHMNRVVMAPFCVHDCFHMHWRWAANGSEPGTFGYDGARPNSMPGRPMVPLNQDVLIRMDAPNVLVYEAHAFSAQSSEWQIFCHHGAAYLLHVGFPMRAAREAVADFGYDNSNVYFKLADGSTLSPTDSWAAFYWHLRYYVEPEQDIATSPPQNRTIIIDYPKILKA